MKTTKRVAVSATIASLVAAYLIGYLVIRSNSHRMYYSEKGESPVIFFGVTKKDFAYLLSPVGVSESDSKYQRIAKRQNLVCGLYYPLFWVDQKLTGNVIDTDTLEL